MLIKQVHEIVNAALQASVGETAVLAEDLTNVVDMGNAVFNANAKDAYVKALINHIGRVIFSDRKYSGAFPSVMMDNWEFGSVCEKVHAHIPEAQENESWELEDGASYDQDIFYKPEVEVKFFNSKTTFEIPCSFTDRQVKQSFSNASQLNAFISMLFNEVDKGLIVATDNLIARTIANMACETIHDDYGADSLDSKTGVKAINLLYAYNQLAATPLTDLEHALVDAEFIKFASFTIKRVADRLTRLSALYNVGGERKFTPRESLKIIMWSDFADAADVYLQSSTFHNTLTALPQADSVPYWQGSGTAYESEEASKLNIKTAAGNDVEVTGVLCVMFDRDALGVTNYDRRVTTHYNAKAEFNNNYYKQDAGYYNDLNENFVVFFAM